MPAVHKRIMSAEYTDATHTSAIIVIEGGGRMEINKFRDPLDWQEMLQSVPLKHYQAPQAVADAMRSLPPPVQTQNSEIMRLQTEIAALKARPVQQQTIDLDALVAQLMGLVRSEIASQIPSSQVIDITPRIEAIERVLKEAVS